MSRMLLAILSVSWLAALASAQFNGFFDQMFGGHHQQHQQQQQQQHAAGAAQYAAQAEHGARPPLRANTG
jgi:type II secretory pathway component PulK